MNLIDTHIHFYAGEYDADRDELLKSARQSGVQKLLLPNIDTDTLQGMLELCSNWSDTFKPMFGLHPCSVKEDFEIQLQTIRESLMKHSNAVAIGETGLDFYWDLTYKKEQEAAFRQQVDWAIEFDLPVVIHSRNATDELINILNEINNPLLRGVFHCFSGTPEQAAKILQLGFYLGIGGVVTFKNSGLDKIIPGLPLDRIVLETDGPYLAPVPYRGKRNEPGYLKLIADKVASLKGISLEAVAEATTKNASMLFKI